MKQANWWSKVRGVFGMFLYSVFNFTIEADLHNEIGLALEVLHSLIY